jgi:hypothetical protein
MTAAVEPAPEFGCVFGQPRFLDGDKLVRIDHAKGCEQARHAQQWACRIVWNLAPSRLWIEAHVAQVIFV